MELVPNVWSDVLAEGGRSAWRVAGGIKEIEGSEQRSGVVGEINNVGPCDVLVGVGLRAGVDEDLGAVVNDAIGLSVLVPFGPPARGDVGFGAVVGVTRKKMDVVITVDVSILTFGNLLALLHVDGD